MSEMILDNAEGSCSLLPNSDIHFLIYYNFGHNDNKGNLVNTGEYKIMENFSGVWNVDKR